MKTCIYLVALVLLINIHPNLWGQNTTAPDSLLIEYGRLPNDSTKVKTLQELFNWYIDRDWNLAMQYNTEQLKLAKEVGFKKGLGLAHMNAGVLYNYSSKTDSGIAEYKIARDIFRKIKHYRLEAWTIKNLAASQYDKGNYNEALVLLDSAFVTFEKSNSDPAELSSFYNIKAWINYMKGNYKIATIDALKQLEYLEDNNGSKKAEALYQLAALATSRGDYQQAISYNLEAAEIYKKNDDLAFELQCLMDVGINYNSLGNYAKAVEYFEECLPKAETLKDIFFKQGILHDLGSSYVYLNKLDDGIRLLQEGVELAKIIGNENKLMAGYNALGYTFNKKEDYVKAKFYYDQVISSIDSTDSKTTLSFAYLGRSTAYEKSNNYSMALKDFKTYKSLTDSIYNSTKSQQIEELNTIYETEKKEQQILLQEKDIMVLEKEVQINYQQKILLGGGLGLSLLTIGFGFYGFRQKIKRNLVEKQRIDAELAFKKKELTTHALHLAKKNEVLENIKAKAKTLKEKEGAPGYQELIKTIKFDQQDDKNWESFTQYFEQVHKDFAADVKKKYPQVTKNELRFMALMKMNMSSKEIANILNISISGVKKARNRLRKKLGITPNESLEGLIITI
ncbi:tetratricopeptide repeat protein [Eudoraea chungangensis]|uniref:tetratricopeptide repeat protein n=1 Tax=Eudoraea chungangensis TaxID=1481905 RepID=UPI0023EB9CD3|nr:tetratricopeptide repeat protein [Eudoraea chungangensis]